MLYQSGNIGPVISVEVFGTLPYISLFISESRRKHISCGHVFIRRENCSQRKVFSGGKGKCPLAADWTGFCRL